MRRLLQRANEKIGTNWTLHDLRHTLASQLANDPGMSITDVQTVMRHRQLSTTQRYVHTDVEQLHEKLQEHYLRPRPPQTYTPGYDAEDIAAVSGD